MKYLKIYESFSKNIEIGDYVIMSSSTNNKEFKDFLSKNIGTVIANNVPNDNNNINVKYENIPEEFKDEFVSNKRYFPIMRLQHFSKNKEDLEQFILNNKYNL